MGYVESKRFQKNIYFYLIVYTETFVCVNHNKQWKTLKEMVMPDHFTCLLRNLCAGQEITELDVELTASKLVKEYEKVVYCHPAYLTYLPSTSWGIPGWMNQSWGQDCQENYQQPQIYSWYYLMAESEEELKSFLMRPKEIKKTDSKLNINKQTNKQTNKHLRS